MSADSLSLLDSVLFREIDAALLGVAAGLIIGGWLRGPWRSR